MELNGWVINVDKEARKVVVGKPPVLTGEIFTREIVIPNDVAIVEGAKDEKGEIKKLPKTFDDLIPGKTRVSILVSTRCPTPGSEGTYCEEAKIVNILEQKQE